MSNAGLVDPGLDHAELDAAWVAARAEIARRFLRIVTILATAGHLAWVPVDFALEPAVAWQLLALRGVDEVLTIALYLIGRRETRLPRLMTCIALLFLGIGIAVALMFAFVREYHFAYVLGLMMILFASGLFVAWSTAYQLATNLFVFAAYLLVSWTRSSASIPILIGSSVVLGCVILVVATMSAGRLHLERRAFLAGREAERRTRELAAANARLEELDRAKTEFFSNITHELRTPLTLILAPLETLIETPGRSAEDLHHLACMQRSALRLLSLISDLLSLTRLDTVGLANEPRSVDLAALVRGVGDEVRPLAARNDITLSIEGCDAPVYAWVDPGHLEKVLLNLLSNALKFTDRHGRVSLAVLDSAEGITLGVRDTGIGIPREALARIFDRFEQLDAASTRAFGGTGIGLSLVAALTRLLGGEISVTSELGSGSCFTLLLPPGLRRSGASDGPAAAQPGLGRRANLAVLERDAARLEVCRAGEHGARVLVAEDDPDLAGELVSMLSQRFRVTTVGDGEAALRYAAAESPDVVVSDVMMPKVDGVQLCAALRERPEFREIPVILLTARSELDDRVRGRQVGADTYLTKPFHPRELIAAIDGLLRARMRFVGSYLIRRRLGTGGQGNVFLGEHHETGELAAVKIVAESHWGDELARRRIRVEREALRRLRHPNVVRVLEHGDHGGGSHLAMELIRGRTLLEALAGRPGGLSAHAVAIIGERLCDAVAAVHAAGLVHGDLKPGNVMLTLEAPSLAEAVRLIDFGAAREGVASETARAGVLGTMRYVAPEVLAGTVPSPASDVYGLGACLLHMAAGERFVAGEHPPGGGPRGDTALRAGALVPGLDPELGRTIDRALEAEPALRWPDAASMASELRRIAARLLPDGDSLLGPASEPTTVAL